MEQLNNIALDGVLQTFHDVAKESVKRYHFLNGAHVKMIDYSENATYLIQKEKEKYILRVNRPNYHSKEEIEAEINWLLTLHDESAIEVSLPIKADDATFVNSVEIHGITYHSSLFTFVDGKAPDEDKEEDLVRQFETIGKISATFHKYIIENHDQYKNYKRMTWDCETILGENPKWGKWQDGLGFTPERIALYNRASKTIKRKLEKFGKDKTRYGLIHSDLRLANLLLDGEKIKVIDFDDCGFSWYLHDLASSLSFIEHKPYVKDLIQSWLKGYSTIRTLTDEEIEMIPTFILMRRLQLISWIGSRDNDTARYFGEEYTIQSDPLVLDYLAKFEKK
ncbi:phosphotransferase enzyme family protein [Lysinibacillus antri]|uniref:Serine kinase n=1 Tax=Lysinibacillus antri TaxID=2498145 RepID=A0A3S0RL77_9BACI|nr:phosphotransferase [Lysinibacillus antri]RUL55886.1 serine kinase [Lysinibacillus antri]